MIPSALKGQVEQLLAQYQQAVMAALEAEFRGDVKPQPSRSSSPTEASPQDAHELASHRGEGGGA